MAPAAVCMSGAQRASSALYFSSHRACAAWTFAATSAFFFSSGVGSGGSGAVSAGGGGAEATGAGGGAVGAAGGGVLSPQATRKTANSDGRIEPWKGRIIVLGW